jgi:hypothetical protein
MIQIQPANNKMITTRHPKTQLYSQGVGTYYSPDIGKLVDHTIAQLINSSEE